MDVRVLEKKSNDSASFEKGIKHYNQELKSCNNIESVAYS